MKITLLQVGKTRAKPLAEGAAFYRKKLAPYTRVQSIVIPDQPVPQPLTASVIEAIQDKEAQAIIKRWPAHVIMTALDGRGEAFSSLEFARWMEEQHVGGQSHLGFVIGGVVGLSDAVLAKSQRVWSLSRLTFPHQMVPMLVWEQLYRAFRIIRQEPYHY